MLTTKATKTITGSKLVIDTLKNLGVDTIFGYPGGIVLDLYDELYSQSDIKHILVRHEQSAVHAAEGYARITDKCGVVLVTSGPGATNTVSGIVNAYLDGYPLVILTGQVLKNLIGKDAFQEANICKITKTCTKKVFQISNANEIQKTLKEAFRIAQEGKKGPVVVDMVKDIFSQEVGQASFDLTSEQSVQPTISDNDVSRIAKRIFDSSKPVIVTGGGVTHSKAYEKVHKLSKTLNIPIVSTMMGLGTFPQDDKSYFGMIGIFGENSANQILKDSDLIISLGARFNDRITCMFKDVDLSEKFIQIDINESEISRTISALDYVVGDISQTLEKINELAQEASVNFKTWLNKAQSLRLLNKDRVKRTNLMHSFEVMREIENYTKEKKNIIFTSEVGQHQLWAVQNLSFNKDRKILVSGGSGTMGFGFPAAIGACIANPTATVVCITGDGSFQMSEQELATCKEYGLNLKIMILNNGYLGMVRQLQEKNHNGRYSQTKILNPDFLKLAESYGIKAKRVTSAQEIKETLKVVFSTKEPYITDFCVEPMELL